MFYSQMMVCVLEGKEYGAFTTMVYLAPFMLMHKRNKTLQSIINLISIEKLLTCIREGLQFYVLFSQILNVLEK